MAEAAQPGWADLGLWNVFANPDLPAPQAGLTSLLAGLRACAGRGAARRAAPAHDRAVRDALPALPDAWRPLLPRWRDERLEEVADHYREFSALARRGQVRNGDPRLLGIALVPADSGPLAAFLRSLNEDFE